ncbi:MAG: T9SS type A sorting domain-containing protein [Ekhidna sp.]|uniref:T9SS type A sorting domain-containing protein n=1 Tax=Ekhidna sp. TaxID=2608089 RepID=UPI0032F0756D
MRKLGLLSLITSFLMLFGFNSVSQTVTSITRADGNPTNSTTVNFTVVFQSATTGVVAGNFTLDASGPSGTIGTPTTSDDITWNVPVTTVSGDGTLSIDFVSGSESPITAAFNAGDIYNIDQTSPDVTIDQGSGQLDPTNSASIVFDIVFNEPVTGFTDDTDVDFSASTAPGALSGVVAEVAPMDGTTYTLTVTGMTGDGDVIASLNAGAGTDAAGNTSNASSSSDNSVSYDGTSPEVTINQASGQLDPTAVASVVFDVVFDEPVTGFTDDTDVDFSASTVTGTLSGVVAEVGPMDGTTYTLTVTGMTGDGDVIVSLNAGAGTDAVGNTSNGSSSTDNSVTYDTTSPDVTIDQGSGQSDPTNVASVVFDVVFTEPVTGFTDDTDVDFSASTVTGTLSGVVAEVGPMDGTTYTLTVTGMTGDGDVIASLNAGAGTDAAGNTSNASSSSDNSVTYDGTLPTFTNATFYDTDQDGSVDQILLEFSEDIDEASVSDAHFNIGGAGLGVVPFGVVATPAANGVDLTDSDNYITLGVDLGTTDDQSVDYNQGTLADESGNLAASNSFTTFDLAPPVLTDIQMEDTDDDALVDRVVLVFSEIVSDADDNDTYVVADVGTITLPDGETATGYVDGDIVVGNISGIYTTVAINNITGQLVDNTALGSFNVAGVNGFWDDDQDQLSIGDGSENRIDAASPVLLNTVVSTNSVAELTFSEGVWGNAGATLPVTTSNFVFDIGGGVVGESVVSVKTTAATESDDLVNVLVGGETNLKVFFSFTQPNAGGETLTMNTDGNIYDNALNTAAATQFPPDNQDVLVAPSIPKMVSAEWRDGDGDGMIDRVALRFSIDWDIDETGSPDNNDGLDCFAITNGATPVTQDNIDYDNTNNGFYTAAEELVILFTGDEQPGTSIDNLQITYVDGTDDRIESQATEDDVVNGDTPTNHLDGAAPRFSGFSATILDTNADGNVDQIQVDTEDHIDDSAINPAEFTYNGVAAVGVANVDNTDKSFFLVVNGNGTGVEGDFIYTVGTLADTASNVSNGGTILAANITDGAGPVILSALTEDTEATPDGLLDQITITFSENLANIYGDQTFFSVDEGGDNFPVISATPGASDEIILAITEGSYTGGPAGPLDTHITPDITITAGFGDDAEGALTPAQTFTNTSDGAAPYSTVDLQNTGNGNPTTDASPNLTGTVDDPNATVLVNVSTFTRTATNNGNGTWSFNNTGSAPAGFTLSALGDYEVTAIAVDPFGNTSTDVTNDELTLEGGANITAATPAAICTSDGFVALGQIRIQETQNNDFASGGTILLTLPEGFEFNTAQAPSFGGTTTDIDATGTFIGTASLRLNITYFGATGLDDLQIDNLEVQATLGGQTGVALERAGGTASLLTTDTDYAVLTSNSSPVAIGSVDVGGSPFTESYSTSYLSTTLVPYSIISLAFTNGETVTFGGNSSGTGVIVSGTITGSTFEIYPNAGATINNGGTITGGTSTATATVNGAISQGTSTLSPFTLTVNPGGDDAVWLNGSGSPIDLTAGGTDLQQTTGTNAELSATSPGVYTFDISVDDGGTCVSETLRFNVLIYQDIDGAAIGSNTFADRNFITTQVRDTIFVTQPTNHTVTVTGTGISGQQQSANNPSPQFRQYFFDPGLAGEGVHTITFTTTNNLTGESVSLQADFTVTLPIDFFEEVSLPTNLCASDLPLALTVDKTAFQPGQDLDYVYILNYTTGSPFQNFNWYAFNSEFPGYTGVPATSVYEFEFDFRSSYVAPFPALDWDKFGYSHELADGDAYAYLVYRTLSNPFVQPVDNIFVYGTPIVEVSNVSDAYCNTDEPFTIERTATYVSGFTAQSPGNEYTYWIPNRVEDEIAEITTGYVLWTESVPGSGVYDVMVEDFTEAGQGMGNEVNIFDPSDPDQDGMFNASEAQNYRIIYTTEPLTGAGCEGQAFFDVTVDAPDAAPTLDATTLAGGFSTGFNNNASPDDGVDADEYVLEYCVGDVLANFTATNINTFGFNPILSGTITFPAGPTFQVGDAVIGQTSGAKGAVISVTATTVFVTSVTGNYRDGETIIGDISAAVGTVTSFVESELGEEIIQGLSSGETATITSIGTTGFVVTGQSGPFTNNEIIVGQSSMDRVSLIGAGEVSWYDESFNRISAFENGHTINSISLGLNVNASNVLTAAESQTFYFSQSSIYGCESDLRKVVVNVFSNPAVPSLDITGWPTAVKVGDIYTFDYCVEDDGSSTTPDPLLLVDLDPDESYNITREFRDFSAGSITVANATITEPGVDTNQESDPVPDIFAGDTIIYTITKTEDISLEAYNNFPGCTGSAITVWIAAQEEAPIPTAGDFNGGTLEFHICEGQALSNIVHTFVNGTDEYIWYEAVDGFGNGVTQLGGVITFSGTNFMDATTLGGAANAFNINTPAVYNYYVSKNDDVITTRSFDGCESEASLVSIEVHAIQPAPTIASNNIAYPGINNFTDQDGNLTDDNYTFAICSDQLLPNMRFDAQDLYSGDEQVEWIRDLDGIRLFVGESPTFGNLGLVGLTPGTYNYTVQQVTDTLTDSFGNFFEGCPSDPASITIEVSEPEPLEIVDDLGTALGTSYCREDDPLGDMSGDLIVELEVDGVTANPANVDYTVDSYLSFVGNGSPEMTSGSGFATLNLISLHDAVAGSQDVGGNPTVHFITFNYSDPATFCTSSISTTITVYPAPNVSIAFNEVNQDALEFCYDDDIVAIQGWDVGFGVLISSANGTGSFSINTGGGLANTANNRAEFNPRLAHNAFHGGPSPFATSSMHRISYTYTDQFTCQRDTSLIVIVHPRPEVLTGAIQTANTCITDDIELFVDMPGTTEGDFTYLWKVGNDTVGIQIADEDGMPNDERLTFANPPAIEDYSVIVTNIVTGCVITIEDQEIALGAAPDPSIAWVGTTEGRNTLFTIFEDNPDLANDNVDSVGLRVNGSQIFTSDASGVPGTFTFPFDIKLDLTTAGLAPGFYSVDLGMRTLAGCRVTVSRTLEITSHVTGIGPTNSYTQDFESGATGWTIETISLDGKRNDLVTSWEIGAAVPDISGGQSYQESNALYTNGYQPEEQSFVYSPSLDLSAFSAPTVSFLRYEEFETFRDGVVFQYSIDDGRNWVNVGSYDASLESQGLASTPGWYNREAITSSPGFLAPGPNASGGNGQGIGWALVSDWELAVSPIEIDPIDADSVRFRFALAAQAGTKSTDGFAIDDFQIYERNQVVLLETFSSSLNAQSIVLSDTVNNQPAYAGSDILKINYFTGISNTNNDSDQINQRNESDPGARVAFYGIGDLPYLGISGDINFAQISFNPFEFDNSNALRAKLANARLANPAFDIGISASVDSESNLVVGANFTASSAFTNSDKIGLFIAIVEPNITLTEDMGLYSAGSTVENILRKLLPSAAGQFEQGPVLPGEVLTIEPVEWAITGLYDPSNLRVIAFAQDLVSKDVYQAAFVDVPTGLSNNVLGLDELSDFNLYPNPADKQVTVEFEDGISEYAEWVVYDQAGREVLKGQISKGTRTMTVQTSEIPSGMYFIHLYAEDRKRQAKRIMVIH